MREMKKKFLAGLCLAFTLSLGLGAFAACGGGATSSESVTGEKTEYTYQYNDPFSDAPDDFMTLDGKLDEEEWNGQQKLRHSSNDATYEVTTIFTEKGLYVGAIAYDEYIYWEGRYQPEVNSTFTFEVVGPDIVQNYKKVPGGIEWIPMNTFEKARFELDYLTCRSHVETRYLSAAYLDGTINLSTNTEKYQTKSLSVELFVTWEELHIDTSNGIPDQVKMYATYRKIPREDTEPAATLRPFSMTSGRLETYYEFGEEGLLTRYDSDFLNNAKDGPSATDMWLFNEDGDAVRTEVNRTQIIWFDGMDAASDFSIEATVQSGPITDEPLHQGTRSGFMLYSNETNYKIYCVNTRSLNITTANGDKLYGGAALELGTSSRTDGQQWFPSGYGLRETIFTSGNYTEEKVTLKLVKNGEYLYYFYNGVFWDVEFVEDLSGDVFAGLFTNGAAEFTDIEYVPMTAEEALAEVKEYVYFIDVPGVMAEGIVDTNKPAVRKGGSVTLDIRSNDGYVLADIYSTKKENSIYGLVNGRYAVFTPDETNVDETGTAVIEAVFGELDRDSLKELWFAVEAETVEGKKESVPYADYTITDENGQLYYEAQANDSGYIMLNLPRAGTCNVLSVEDGSVIKALTISGNYTLNVKRTGYIEKTVPFNVPATDNGDEDDVVITLKQLGFGVVTVNGMKTEDNRGSLSYDEGKGLYYDDNHVRANGAGYTRQYFYDKVASDYAVTATVTTEAVDGQSNLVTGIILSTGGGSSNTVIFKTAAWEANKLVLQVGNKPGDATYSSDCEISVSGFNHSLTGEGGTVTFTIVRYENAIYVFDKEGDLGIILTKDGVELVGDHGTSSSQKEEKIEDINKNLRTFFADINKENVVGVVNYYSFNGNANSGRSYYDIQMQKEKEQVKENYVDKLGFYSFEVADTEEYTAELDGKKTALGYIPGATLKLTLDSKKAKQAAIKLVFTYDDESTQEVIGKYDYALGVTVFEFFGKAGLKSVEVSEWKALSKVTGRIRPYQNGEKVTGVNVVFESEDGLLCQTTSDAVGYFTAELLYGTYSMVATKSDRAVAMQGVEVDAETKAIGNVTLQYAPYYVGDTTVNGKTVKSQGGAALTIASLGDGAVAIPGHSGLNVMYNVIPNTKTLANESFVFTADITGDITVPANGNLGATQIGIGLTDGTYWWTFAIKADEDDGQNIIVTLNSYALGGNDFVITSTNANAINKTDKKASATLTVVKTAEKLELWAGKGETALKVFEATKEGYTLFGGTYRNQAAQDKALSHKARMANFFGENEIVGMYGSNDYRATMTLKPSFAKRTFVSAPLTGAITGATEGVTAAFTDTTLGITTEVPVSTANGQYSISGVPTGTYTVEFKTGALMDIMGDVVIGLTTTTIGDIALKDGTYFIGDATINRMVVKNSTGLTLADRRAALSGTVTIPEGSNRCYYGFPMTKVTGVDSYEFTAHITATNSNNDNMVGIGITTGNRMWFFTVKGGENGGQYLIVENRTHAGPGNDFVVRCENSNSIVAGGATDVWLTIKKTSEKLEVYAGAVGSQTLVLTATTAGYNFHGATVNILTRVHEFASFFTSDVEQIVCYASNWHPAAATYTATYKKN